MTTLQKAAVAALVGVFLCSLCSSLFVAAPYQQQFREHPSAPPSKPFPLGTDELGRDRLSRLLYGTRVSLLLAPAAALLGTVLATLLGASAALAGGWVDRAFKAATDLSLSLPWLFALITLRAMLPLDVSPAVSITVTFALLGLLGWAAPARIVRASVANLRQSEFMLQAKASGLSTPRLIVAQLLPNLGPVLLTQFFLAIPVFILSEANLGLLGLGVSEPMPSWGNLLRDLENINAITPSRLAPAILLALVVTCFQLVTPREDFVS